jgi:hypothetical protein
MVALVCGCRSEVVVVLHVYYKEDTRVLADKSF